MNASSSIPQFGPVLPQLPLAPAKGPGITIRFHNRREIWQVKRAARVLNRSFNTYVREVIDAHSAAVLAATKVRGRGKRGRKANGNGAGAGRG